MVSTEALMWACLMWDCHFFFFCSPIITHQNKTIIHTMQFQQKKLSLFFPFFFPIFFPSFFVGEGVACLMQHWNKIRPSSIQSDEWLTMLLIKPEATRAASYWSYACMLVLGSEPCLHSLFLKLVKTLLWS